MVPQERGTTVSFWRLTPPERAGVIEQINPPIVTLSRSRGASGERQWVAAIRVKALGDHPNKFY